MSLFVVLVIKAQNGFHPPFLVDSWRREYDDCLARITCWQLWRYSITLNIWLIRTIDYKSCYAFFEICDMIICYILSLMNHKRSKMSIIITINKFNFMVWHAVWHIVWFLLCMFNQIIFALDNLWATYLHELASIKHKRCLSQKCLCRDSVHVPLLLRLLRNIVWAARLFKVIYRNNQKRAVKYMFIL